MKRAAKILRSDLVWLDYEDASVPAGDELRETLVEVYRKLKPDIVITFHPLVWRDDHRRVGLAANDATLKAGLPLHETAQPYHRPEPEVYFFGETMVLIELDAYVDVTVQMETKHRAFLCHASQWVSWEIDETVDPDHREKIWTKFRDRFAANGARSGVSYAEAFVGKERIRRAPWFLPSKI